MTTTSQIRRWWEPACRANVADLEPAYSALDSALRRHGYRPRAGVTGAYNCRRITGGTGYSLHAYDPSGPFTFWTGVRVIMALAVDINWDENPYGPVLVTDMPREMIADIKAIRTNSGKRLWRWGGDYAGNKDAMHFEIVVSPDDLATGVADGTLPRPPAPPPPHDDLEDAFMALTPEEQREVLEGIRDLRPTLIRRQGTSYADSVCVLLRASYEKIPLRNMEEVDHFKQQLEVDRVVALPSWKYDLYRTRER